MEDLPVYSCRSQNGTLLLSRWFESNLPQLIPDGVIGSSPGRVGFM